MNLFVIHAHDMGRHCGPYGGPARTPHLDRFARSAVVFEDAHCAAPTCSPSRAAMWTGRTAHENGMLGLVHRGFDLNDRSRHLARVLAAQGYHTALAGLQHEYDPDHDDAIYRQVLPVAGASLEGRDAASARAAAAFLQNPPEQAWMLSLGLYYPHRPFVRDRENRATQVRGPEHLPDLPEVREDYADYLATVEIADAAIGLALDALENSGQADRTLVVITTDHGIAFPEMKCQLTAAGTGVALLLRGPGRFEGGRRIDALASHLDLVPTICDYLEIPPPEGLHGRSLRPVLDGSADSIREDLFAEVNFHAAAEPARGVRTKDHSYIRRFDDDPRVPLSNIDAGESKQAWVRKQGGAPRHEALRLHDLRRDPLERENLIDDPAYAEIRTEMEARLRAWMERTNDPLLKGPLKRPKGAIVNTRDCIDPHDEIFED